LDSLALYESGYKKGNFKIGNDQIGYSFMGGLYIDIVSSYYTSLID